MEVLQSGVRTYKNRNRKLETCPKYPKNFAPPSAAHFCRTSTPPFFSRRRQRIFLALVRLKHNIIENSNNSRAFFVYLFFFIIIIANAFGLPAFPLCLTERFIFARLTARSLICERLRFFSSLNFIGATIDPRRRL